jgi:hypothetical protein
MQKGGEGGDSGAVEKNKKKRAHLGDGPCHRHPCPRHRHPRPRHRHPHPRRRHPHPRRRCPRPRRRRCSCRRPRCFPGRRWRRPSLSSSSRPLSSLSSLFRIHWHCGWCGQKKNERIKKRGRRTCNRRFWSTGSGSRSSAFVGPFWGSARSLALWCVVRSWWLRINKHVM